MEPIIVRKLLLPAHERLMGRGTLQYLRELEKSQWHSTAQLRELQLAKLRRLLAHAAARTPYYRDRIAEARIDPSAMTLSDLPRIPLTSKTDISANIDRMIDRGIPGGLRDATTGGSTGVPLAFKTDRFRQAADQAARARSRRWFGIDLGERELYLWGSPIEQTSGDVLKSVRDRLTNHRMLNAFAMTPRTMARYIETIRRFDPVHLFGYPSSLARLARFAVDTGLRLKAKRLRAVFTSGELLMSADRATLEEFFAVPVGDGYGSREGGFVAQQCPHGAYHVTMESLIVEIIQSDGRIASDDETGEIVLTHLDARGMPFIRYRTGDLARRSNRPCPCGRGLEILEMIEGRRTDQLRRADGGHAHALSVIYVLRNEPCIAEFKVTQRPSLDLDVQIVPRGAIDGAGQSRIAALLSRQIGGAQVRLHITDSIAPDCSGKHRHVVSEAT